ncbi:DinB family protein [Flaviramulus sp. BrNp1-15]|uniref:DinB family protein n=1 Tax=Flaviramulus sp. BrNp1-15 TaxID=2916754 RepID=UPI001EE97B3B|nr:DinB family protein [Flaviramulus sp. BrNp1-15]ULC59519.1 DinB family protein [Flaviramulus sp. BrNp1-15]
MEYNINQSFEILERTPKTLLAMLSNLSDEWVFSNEGEDTWSPFDVIGHLIHCEKCDWVTRAKIILSNSEDKTFEPFDRFAQFEISKGKTMSQLLSEFLKLREKNLEYLKSVSITESNYNFTGKHPHLGEVTLKQLLASWVVHDLGHIAQISRVMAKQYKSEVGPWKAYLSILN